MREMLCSRSTKTGTQPLSPWCTALPCTRSMRGMLGLTGVHVQDPHLRWSPRVRGGPWPGAALCAHPGERGSRGDREALTFCPRGAGPVPAP